ncbi:MAG: L-threonylcarbamoyladenylate synthase [Oscillospiraceae bacterium]
MKTLVLHNEITGAADIIRAGGLAAVPTETVYGLAVNALDERAVRRLYEAKGRPETKPISLFVPDMKAAERFCADIPEEAYVLAERFWPGPLTMIFKRRELVPDIITAGGNTVGIRCPDDKLTLALLKETGLPLTGTSANLSGMPNAVNIGQVLKYFDGVIGCAVDGGECPGGVPSTIVDMTSVPPKILRLGGISREELEEAVQMVIL